MSIQRMFDCDEIQRVHEVYDFKYRLWAFMEMMPAPEGNLTDVCEKAAGKFSEASIKYFCLRGL